MRCSCCMAGSVVSLVVMATAALAAEGFRTLAPGVLTVIPPFTAASDTVVRGDITEITVGHQDLGWKPRHAAAHTTFVERGRDREYPRDIWCLEFAFKAPRTIEVDVPAVELRMRRKRIWYLVYRVRNVGGRRTVIDAENPADRAVQSFDEEISAFPQLVLESRQPLAAGEGGLTYRAYLDRVIPAALEPIRRREDPTGTIFTGGLLDSASMAAATIPAGDSRWGVATWEDVDPRIDFFSIYVTGLTNAMQWRQRAGVAIAADDEPGSGRERALQSLRLDFWRPGDDRNESSDQTSVGFAGMFERMTLGGRLLDDLGRPRSHGSDPLVVMRRLGLGWTDLLAPTVGDDPSIPDWQPLGPLRVVLERLAAVTDEDERLVAAQQFFGDVGSGYLQELAAAVEASAADGGPQRRAALEQLGVTAEGLPKEPLAALAALLPGLDALAPSTRRTVAEAVMGPAARRIDWLAREVEVGRTAGALAELGGESGAVLGAGDARAAFDVVQPFLAAEADPARRRQLIRGLFGPRGPVLQAAAAAVHEGVDHAWVYRYED
jgi:hypothetical protein